jgi:predicted glycosyltransferase involved in capsule biosynthesis
MKYSVAITTYHVRFNDWLKPLVLEIVKQRPEVEIILSVNGEHNIPFKEDYRKEMLEFIKPYPNIFPIFYPRFRSLTRMWNLGLQFASNEIVLMLEDDIYLKEGFFDEYEEILKTGKGKQWLVDREVEKLVGMFKINDGYAAISCNRRVVDRLNWFDERFLGLGHEDGEFNRKYLDATGFYMPNLEIKTVDTEAIIIENEPRLAGQRIETRFNRYNEYNAEMADFIYKTPYVSKQYPHEENYWDNKDKL